VSFRRMILLIVPVVVCLLYFPQTRVAGDDWQPIDPADLKMTSEPKAPGAPASYLYRQVDRKDTGRTNTEYNYVRIKVLTEEGRESANVAIPYVSQNTHISNVRARTIHPDGSIVNFDGKVYDKMVEKTKGTKVKAKVFTCPDVQVGSIVEYRFNYDFEGGYVFDSYWALSDDLFTRKAVFSLVPYPEFAVRWDWPAGLPLGSEPPKVGPDKVVRMTVTNVPAFQEEDYMPPTSEVKFRVLFIYSEDGFEVDPAKFWKKFGKKENDRMESFLGKKKELEAAVSQVVSAGDTPEVKLRKIYERVEQIRNLSYEARKSEQEEKRDKLKRAENAADVLKNGYGNGVDITWTFMGLARAAGLETYGLMISRRNEYFFNEKRMNKRELDSNAVMVKVDGKEMFFDPGSKFVPYGLLPWEESGVKGMKLDKEGGTWVSTNWPESTSSQIQRTADLKLNDEGTLEGTVKLAFTGLEGWSRRVRERNEDSESRKKYLEEELKAYVPMAIEAELTNQPDWNATEPPLVAEFKVKITGWVSSAGKRALLPVGIFAAPEKQTFAHADRVYPICFSYPYQKKDDVTIEMPSGWTISSVPASLDKDAKAAEYVLNVENKKTAVHITRMVRSDLYLVPKDTYPALRTFYQTVRSGDDQQIVLQPAAVAAAH
jgi:PHD/YefM family antitoxin component YafN of YafNO toxin-antitoxin module